MVWCQEQKGWARARHTTVVRTIERCAHLRDRLRLVTYQLLPVGAPVLSTSNLYKHTAQGGIPTPVETSSDVMKINIDIPRSTGAKMDWL